MDRLIVEILAFEAPVPDAIWGGALLFVIAILFIAWMRARAAVDPLRDDLILREQRRIARHAKTIETKLVRERTENRRLKRQSRSAAS